MHGGSKVGWYLVILALVGVCGLGLTHCQMGLWNLSWGDLVDRQLSGGTPGPEHSGSGSLYIGAFAAVLSWPVRSPEHWEGTVRTSVRRNRLSW